MCQGRKVTVLQFSKGLRASEGRSIDRSETSNVRTYLFSQVEVSTPGSDPCRSIALDHCGPGSTTLGVRPPMTRVWLFLAHWLVLLAGVLGGGVPDVPDAGDFIQRTI